MAITDHCIAMIAGAMALAGCASLEDPKHLMADGWRLGRIVEIGNASRISGGASLDCRDHLPPDRVADRLFARVGYQDRKRTRTIILPISESAFLKPGDLAWIKASDCAVPPQPYGRGRWLWG